MSILDVVAVEERGNIDTMQTRDDTVVGGELL